MKNATFPILTLSILLSGALAHASLPIFSCATDRADRVKIMVSKNGQAVLQVENGKYQAVASSGRDVNDISKYVIDLEKKPTASSESVTAAGSGGAKGADGHAIPVFMGSGLHFISCQLN